MRTTKIFLFITGLLLSLTSCNDWLNLYPDNAQTSDQYWETKEDVESVIGAGYVKLRNSVNHLFVWGEIRGNSILVYNVENGDNMNDAERLQQVDVTNTNAYCKWSNMYQVINMANSVLRYAPSVIAKDPSFTIEEMNSYFSEAYFLRSLAYFYLIRTFKDVPYVTEPYVKDEGNYDIPKMEGDKIMDLLIEDLKTALPSAKSYFLEVNVSNPMNTKGRATKWAINALLADIYLWKEQFQNCIDACDEIINSERVGLIGKDLWFTNYYPGNSNESIYEIQYNYNRRQTNSFFDWFYTYKNYVVSVPTIELFIETTPLGDIRGEGGTFYGNAPWKYIGKGLDDGTHATRNSGNENDQNYIIYRLADIYMMKAEAQIMMGAPYYQQAMDIISLIRNRAGIEESSLATYSNELDMLQFLMEERRREFCGEGKTWFDLLRISSYRNYAHKNYMIEEVLQIVFTNRQGIVRSKLADPGSYYLPIHKDELVTNRLLEQSEYYKNLGY